MKRETHSATFSPALSQTHSHQQQKREAEKKAEARDKAAPLNSPTTTSQCFNDGINLYTHIRVRLTILFVLPPAPFLHSFQFVDDNGAGKKKTYRTEQRRYALWRAERKREGARQKGEKNLMATVGGVMARDDAGAVSRLSSPQPSWRLLL